MHRLSLAAGLLAALAFNAPAAAQVVAFDCFPLNGTQEVPANGSAATGLGNAWFDPVTNVLSWNISWTGVTATAAHFHGPAAPGVNAGVILSIGTTTPNTGSAVLTAAQEIDLLAGNWYVNVHSAAFPGGEIRGQVVNVGCVVRFESFPVNAAQEVPANGSPGAGIGSAWLNQNNRRLQWHIGYGGLTGAVTASHFHGPAAPGVNAGVQLGVGVANPTISSAILTTTQVSQVTSGLWYYNVHSATFPGGEIRGQVVNVARPQWINLGLGKPGFTGTPALLGTGPLTGGSTNQVDLVNGRASSTTNVIIGFSAINFAYKGGTIVPSTDILFLGLPIDAFGGNTISFVWPVGVPAGTPVWIQEWVSDAGAHLSLAATNGLIAVAQ